MTSVKFPLPQNNSNTVYNPENDVNQLTETTITKDATDVSKEELKKRADEEAEKKAIEDAKPKKKKKKKNV